MMDSLYTLRRVTLTLCMLCVIGYSQAVTIHQNWMLGTADTCKMAPNQSVVYNLHTHHAESLIECLACMQSKNGSLRAVTYNGTTNECAIVDDPSVVPSNGHQYVTTERGFPITNAADKVTCDKPWTKVYEVAADGEVLYGDIGTLTAAVKEGVDLRIQIVPDLFLEMDNVAIKSAVICTSSVFVLSKSSWDTFEVSMFWRYTMVCSDGSVYQGRTYLGKKEELPSIQSFQRSVWYTRNLNMAETHTNPVYCADNNVHPSCGDIADVISASEQGKTVRLAYDFGGSSFYLISVSRLEVEDEPCGVVGQIPWKVGRISSNGRYSTPYYWYISLIDSMSTRVVTRWYVGEHLLKSESSRTIPRTYWFVESCWDLICMHSANGKPLIGSKKTLIDLMLQGRRVRLVFGPYSMEADNVVIDNDIVTAQLLSQIDTPTARSFTTGDAVWKWVRLSSDGTYAVDLYDVGSSNKTGQHTSTIQAAWVVESRVWRLALSTDSSGNEIVGSKLDLEQAVNAGSRLRCIVRIQATVTLAVTADNIQIHVDGNIAAQFFRLISFDSGGTSNFIPFWRILLITTNGEMKETRWTVGKHVHMGDVVSRVNINWFVD